MDTKQTNQSANDQYMIVDSQSSWKDLPSTVLCHILANIQYKRADVKAVCSSWRQAINSSITDVNIPEADLHLLASVPNVRHLKVLWNRQSQQQHVQAQHRDLSPAEGLSALRLSGTCNGVNTWPPRSAMDPCTHTCDGNESVSVTQVTVHEPVMWPSDSRKLCSQLLSLSLVRSTTTALQLADLLTNGARGTDVAVDSAFSRLRVLKLCGIQCLDPLLCALLQLLKQQQIHSCLQPSSSTSSTVGLPVGTSLWASRDSLGAALCNLEDLNFDDCPLTSTECQQLVLLLQHLPSLRLLQLSGCHQLWSVPAAVCGCTGLTQMVLSNIECLTELPEQISQLTDLQVLDLSGNATLRSLGSGFSKLTSLRSLSLSGPSGLWLDYSVADQAAAAAAGASSSGPALSLVTSAAAARAALPPLLLPALPHLQQLLLLTELVNLSRLETLNLSHNRQLMVVPGCVDVLTDLRVLDVTGCGVRWLNDEVMECVGLQQLLLGDNVLAEVPADITRLTQLKVLDLSACCSLWSLPRSLLNCQSLERLIVASKAVGQHVVEQLELRGSNPVEVVIHPGDSQSDVDDDYTDVRFGSWGNGDDVDDESSDDIL